MQNQPLLLSTLLRHADRFHHSTEIVSRTVEGPIHRYGYGDAARRARKLADALEQFGVGQATGLLRWLGTLFAISKFSTVLPEWARNGTPSTPVSSHRRSRISSITLRMRCCSSKVRLFR